MILINPISPIAINLFGFGIRWYALAYIAAFVVCFYLMNKLNQKSEILNQKSADDLLTYQIFGVILGGRLGYVFFYNPEFFLHNPTEIFAVWRGGMSFHGGLAGVIAATYLFSYHISHITYHKTALGILDRLAVVAPIGLFFGRIANFINMEVMGRATAMPWGVVFAGAEDALPRHPSPLYEAGLEGAALFAIMRVLWHKTDFSKQPGKLSGIFAIGYGIFRIFCEQFRQPDSQLGFLFGTTWLTMGMSLSFIMIAVGIYLLPLRRAVEK